MSLDALIAGLPRKRMAAGVLLRDPADRVLWVEPTYKPNWEIPGGIVEADESPWDCAERELAEELGLHRPVTRLLVVDHVRPDARWPEGVMFVFDGGPIDAAEVDALVLPEQELRSAALLGVDEARARVVPRLAGRVAAALDTVRTGGTTLCDNGTRIA
jgi:8-oxo-dGTP pyrophosphatase MutT (NUDIX family)